MLLEFATVAVKAGDLSAAAKACRRALGLGIDSAKVKELTGKNLELARALGM